jgi:molybdopterin synthase catalytic subunit
MIRICDGPIDMSLAFLPRAGACIAFVGTTRNTANVVCLEYSCYDEMVHLQTQRILDKAVAQFNLLDVDVVYRMGIVPVAEAGIKLVVWSAHRQEGFAAIEWIMAEIKRIVPIWKREIYPDGSAWMENAECVEWIQSQRQ